LPIDFQSPWYLLLLVIVPVVWVLSYRGLAGLGTVRRPVALILRTAVMMLIIFALADIHKVRRSDRLTVMFLVDQSLSIPESHRQRMVGYVREAANSLRDFDRRERDRAGAIYFGRGAHMESPPHDDELFLAPAVESPINRQYTNLAAAIRLARASFPADGAKRVVIVTDGNENLGDALNEAQQLVDDGVSIDVVPIRYEFSREVAVEKVALPTSPRKGQPFDLRVVLSNTAPAGDKNPGVARGRLQIYRKAAGREELRADQVVEIPPGKRVFRIHEKIDQPSFYTYEARFVPEDVSQDTMVQNNKASTFTHIQGSGRVLLIENYEHPGQFDFFASRLRGKDLEVIPQASDGANLFRGLAELQPYDTVVLANVPRDHFSDDQIKALVRNTQQMGAGLIMLGGEHSLGAGGWTNSELEKAMPVEFQIRNTKVAPVGALVMIMHASEMARGNHWQKLIAKEAIKVMGAQDYCGLLHWNGTDKWLWGGIRRVGPNRKMMLSSLERMQPGDMPQFDPAMKLAAVTFANLNDAAIKHMVIISDGDPSPPSPQTVKLLVDGKVTVSTMAVGSHGMLGNQVMQDIAAKTGGKYYVVRDPRALPRYYQKEARRVAQPLVKHLKPPLAPRAVTDHEIIKGIEGDFPPLNGFVLSTVKENELVEVSLLSPQPVATANATVLASWTYGLGRTAVFAADAGDGVRGDGWAVAWKSWEHYDTFFSQLVRWSMRPTGDAGKLTVATEVRDGKVEVIVTALDQKEEFLNFLDLAGKVVGPDMETRDLRLEQVAPGRYRGTFESGDAGSYFIVLGDAGGNVAVRTGVDVPYSSEFRQRDTNESLLENLAGLTPEGGEPGRIIEPKEVTADMPTGPHAALLATNVFRHDLPSATSSQTIWHLLVLCACVVFFADVFVRRVHVNFAWVGPRLAAVRDRILRRDAKPQPDEYIERLRARKTEVSKQIETRRAATRYEPIEPVVDTSAILDAEVSDATAEKTKRPAAGDSLAPQQPTEDDDESYTSRLLKAKKKVWEDRNKPDE
jgi:uncharacterized membrane protein